MITCLTQRYTVLDTNLLSGGGQNLYTHDRLWANTYCTPENMLWYDCQVCSAEFFYSEIVIACGTINCTWLLTTNFDLRELVPFDIMAQRSRRSILPLAPTTLVRVPQVASALCLLQGLLAVDFTFSICIQNRYTDVLCKHELDINFKTFCIQTDNTFVLLT